MKLNFTSTKSDYYLSDVEIEYPESLLPNSNSSDIVKISEKVEKFRTKLDHSYSCRSDAEIKMEEFGQGLQEELHEIFSTYFKLYFHNYFWYMQKILFLWVRSKETVAKNLNSISR